MSSAPLSSVCANTPTYGSQGHRKPPLLYTVIMHIFKGKKNSFGFNLCLYFGMEILGQLYQQVGGGAGGKGSKGENRERKWVTLAEASLGNPSQSFCGHSSSSPAFFYFFFFSCFHSCLSWESDFSLAFVTPSKARNKQVSGCPYVTRHPLADISRLALYLSCGGGQKEEVAILSYLELMKHQVRKFHRPCVRS